MTKTGGRLRAVNFHGIGDRARKLEAGEARYWLTIDRFCQLLDRIAAHAERDRLVITFDDGNISDLTIALPELQRRGLSAAFFILTGRIGQAGSLSSENIRTLRDCGMTIGSHGIAHCDWTCLSPAALKEELTQSKTVLADLCDAPISQAAIPFGRYNATILHGLHAAGYDSAWSSDGGAMDERVFLRPRTSIRHDMSDGEIERVLDGRASLWRIMRKSLSMAIKKRL